MNLEIRILNSMPDMDFYGIKRIKYRRVHISLKLKFARKSKHYVVNDF